jgi:hypothetical protein
MRKTLLMVLLVITAATAEAATRLTYSMNGHATPIQWPSSAFPIPFHTARDIPGKLPQAELAIAHAFGAWQGVSDSSVQFRDGGLVDAAPGRDGINAITVVDDLFADSGFIAYTTNWFHDDGTIVEADIQIDLPSALKNSNLQALIQHEVGHLLGLDHSAVISSNMFPYVSSEDSGLLDSDDRIAVSTMYPRREGDEWGAILQGDVRDGNGPVFGAQVVALSQRGEPVATALTGADGRFTLRGIPDGEYSLYAEPLDGPVESKNLSGIWRDGRAQFRTQFLPGNRWMTVRRGERIDGIELRIDDRPVGLNPRWIGAFAENSTDIRLAVTASTVRSGDTVCVAVGGDGFVSGMTSFEILNEGFTRVSEFHYGPNFVWAKYRVAPETPATSVVIRVSNGDETTALTGAIRVERPARRRPGR